MPVHLPVVLSAIEAMFTSYFHEPCVDTTTHPVRPVVIGSGRPVSELGIETLACALSGGGARANLMRGHATRVLLWHRGGAYRSHNTLPGISPLKTEAPRVLNRLEKNLNAAVMPGNT